MADSLYEEAKQGNWNKIYEATKQNIALAGSLARFTNPSSGWSPLHQAAYWGDQLACKWCIKHGATTNLESKDGKKPADIAREKGFNGLAQQLADAPVDKNWQPAPDPKLMAASCNWDEATKQIATQDFNVGYAGGVVNISTGEPYYTDSWDRVLIGWHGTYSPPCGMDGYPMI
jgi:uncharacterized protein